MKHIPATPDPEALWRHGRRLAERGAESILVSGGSGPDGSVPLEPFAQVMKRLREELGLRVLVHTGLVRESVADALAEAGVDCAMMDVVGDEETIRKVLRLDARPEDFEQALALLSERGVPTAPHVVVGLHCGEIRGERRTLAMIREVSVMSLVLVLFRPTPGTDLQACRPVDPEEVGEFFGEARRRFPGLPLILGCERPLGVHGDRTELLAVRAGMDGIAFPSEGTIEEVKRTGEEIRVIYECCALAGIPERPKQGSRTHQEPNGYSNGSRIRDDSGTSGL